MRACKGVYWSAGTPDITILHPEQRVMATGCQVDQIKQPGPKNQAPLLYRCGINLRRNIQGLL